MKKINALTLAILFLTAGAVVPLTASAQSSSQLVEVGNKHCPVSGKEVGVMGPAFKITYNGKVYNLCCPGCKSTFNSDPQKYSKIAEDDARAST